MVGCSVASATSSLTRRTGKPRACATRATWNSAAAGEMCGCSDEVDGDLADTLGAQPLDVRRDAIDERLAGRAEIGAARGARVVGPLCRQPTAADGSSGRR
jgi:hypothetical protein